MRLRDVVDRVVDGLERTPALDPFARGGSAVWDRVLPNGKPRDALHGVWLGHPLHPVLTDVAIGCWWSSAALDLLGEDRASQRLTGLGVLAAIPTAASGAADFVALGELGKEKRVGVVHAMANATATLLFAASWWERSHGRHGAGKALGALGTLAVSAGGYLGGHLSYRNAVGVDRTAGESGVEEWTDIGNLHQLPMRQPVRRTVGGVDVVVYRIGSTVRVLSATCAHLGGPLDEGTVTDECITCPWHGSTFDLRDGSVVTGPSTHPQPAYDVRVLGRTVQIRRQNGPKRAIEDAGRERVAVEP